MHIVGMDLLWKKYNDILEAPTKDIGAIIIFATFMNQKEPSSASFTESLVAYDKGYF